MRKAIKCVLLLVTGTMFHCFEYMVHADQEFHSLQPIMLITPNISDGIVVCAARNNSDVNLSVPKIGVGLNRFYYKFMDDSVRREISSPSVAVRPVSNLLLLDEVKPWEVEILAKNSYSWIVRSTDIWDGRQVGRYIELSWSLNRRRSPIINIGFSRANGTIVSPIVNPKDTTAKPILAFIFKDNRQHELGFLLLNGTKESVALEKSLTPASRIVATAPGIGYVRDLFVADQVAGNIEIEPGKVGEWRLPWKTVHDLIPKEDLEKIKAAGGDLDLVWKVGDYESLPLPISLAVPKDEAVGETQKQ